MKHLDGPKARKNELAQIHIAIAALEWSDDDYRAILFAKTGKRSASELDSTGRKRFIEHLKACGWKGGAKPETPRYTRQQWHVLMLWKDLGKAGALEDKSEAALTAFIGNLVGISAVRFLDTATASKVIEALKSWLTRAKKAQKK
jgi:phage gp16-like protein